MFTVLQAATAHRCRVRYVEDLNQMEVYEEDELIQPLMAWKEGAYLGNRRRKLIA